MKSVPSTRARSRARQAAALAALAAAACASMDGDLVAARESWRGATYEEVVKAWGVPSQSAVDSHTWLSDDGLPQFQGSAGGAGGVVFGGPGGRPARCDRTVAFRAGRVVDERWSGEPEFCKRFARRAR
jgi:hypothetical protein